MSFSDIFNLLFGWMPAWFSVLAIVFVVLILALLVMKVVAFVIDMLPFV